MECRINDICITPNTTVMYDVKNTNTSKRTFCCNDDLMTFSRRFMAQCQKYKPEYHLKHYLIGFGLVRTCTYAMKHRRKKRLIEMFRSFLLVFTYIYVERVFAKTISKRQWTGGSQNR